MHLSTSILCALALAGPALAAQISFFKENSCNGAPGAIEDGLVCNNCYHFDQAWGAINMNSGFPDDWIWYEFSSDACAPGDSLGAHEGLGCLPGARPIRSVFLKCNGNPGF
ncbi:hypothetical protein MVEN_02551200 [Mycena venus]|uniref:Cyanovirin-N domain-containing protein n=1 Tax=Mycena venus TaxID=2733690 RepID=A0A8H6U3X5_9AGAR|nr:hypothetical protein MVEN_02551200 [Mycena venus]